MRDTDAGAVGRAQHLIEAGEFDSAAELLRELGRENDDIQVVYLLGLAEYRAGRYGAALDSFGVLVERVPDDPRAWYSLAIAREKVGDDHGMVAALDHALQLDQDFAAARNKLTAVRRRRHADERRETADSATLAGKLEESAGVSAPSPLLSSGRRRVSSIGGAVLWAVAVASAGLGLAWSSRSTADRLARWSLLGRTPDHFRDRLADLDTTGIGLGREAIERDLQDAISSLDRRVTVFQSLLDAISIGLLVVAVVIVIGAVLAARLTRYEVYDHRIDVTRGLVRRRTRTLWLFSLTDVVYEQPLWLLVSGDARIRATSDAGGPASIVGYGDADHMRRLWSELREAAVVERRAMRRWWV